MGGSIMKVGIIGGTGLYEMEGEAIVVETNYGDVEMIFFEKHDRQIFFIPRHGKKHKPAHSVNYFANIEAMKNAGVEAIIATSTVGSMKKEIKPGSIFIPNDFIDFTRRKTTFFDDEAVHIDMSQPFCPIIRKILFEEARKQSIAHEGVYVVTQGPRLETKAEISMLRNFADVVGMTLFPEIVLAREKGICYASLCIVSNFAAGLQEKLDIEEIKRIYENKKRVVLSIIDGCIKRLPEERKCDCKNAADKGRI